MSGKYRNIKTVDEEVFAKISPYDFYMKKYWQLRGEWRHQLYAWMRREPVDGTASISPVRCLAGERLPVTLSVSLNEKLDAGGRIAVYFPYTFGGIEARTSMMNYQDSNGQIGYGCRITASCNTDAVELATVVHSTGSVFTCVEVIVESGCVAECESIDIVIGDSCCKPSMVNEKAKSYPFRVAVDFDGNDNFRPIVPNPSIDVVGNRAVGFRCYAPALVKKNQPFTLKIVAVDALNHNPSYDYCGTIELQVKDGVLSGPTRVDVRADSHGIIEIPGLQLDADHVVRICAIDAENGLIGSSNPICLESIVADDMSLYFGEIHSHTDLSDGVGTPENNYFWARDVEGLDFSALADHFEKGQNYNYELADKWQITKDVTEQFNSPDNFVTLLGYEIGTFAGGSHRNVYFPNNNGPMIVEEDGDKIDVNNVFDKLDGLDYILIPHAPRFHGVDWNGRHDAEHQRLVEICSTWGISEEGGVKSVRHALDMGYKLGFTGGTDSHYAEPGNPDVGGITGVYAPALSRIDIFNALIARRTFATSGPRITMVFYVNNALMGSEIPCSESALITGRVVSPEVLKSIEIIRNGKTVHEMNCEKGCVDQQIQWLDPESVAQTLQEREFTGEKTTYYYLKCTTVNSQYAWSSPVWIVL